MTELQGCTVFCYRDLEFNSRVEELLSEKGFIANFYFSNSDQDFILETTEKLHKASNAAGIIEKPFKFIVVYGKRMVHGDLQFKKKMEKRGVSFVFVKELPKKKAV